MRYQIHFSRIHSLQIHSLPKNVIFTSEIRSGIVKEGRPSRSEQGTFHEADKAAVPRIVIPISSLQRAEGQRAHFACRIEPANESTSKVEWLHDGRPLATGKGWLDLSTMCFFWSSYLKVLFS